MNLTVKQLPPCRRRAYTQGVKGDRLFCKPPTRPEGISAAELIKDSRWFKTREVTCDICIGCDEMEPADVQVVSEPRTVMSYEPVKGDVDISTVMDPTPPTIEGDGTIVYKKKGWEPPPVPPGYRRKSSNMESEDAWVMLPEVPPCEHLVLNQVPRENCGCVRVIPTCTFGGKSEHLQSNQCEQCPNKREPTDGPG